MNEVSSPSAGATEVLAPPGPSPSALVQRVESTRQEWLRFLQVRLALRAALLLLAVGGVVAWSDWRWVLGAGARLAMLLLFGALAAMALSKRAAGLRRPVSRQDAADEIESRFPELGQRVSTSLDYAEPSADPMPAMPSLVRALLDDTDQRTRAIDLRRVVPWPSLRRPGTALAALLLFLVILLAASPQARIAVMRLFFLPVHYTQLVVEPGDHGVKAGSDVTIKATVSGRPAPSVTLLSRKAASDDPWTEVTFHTEEDSETLAEPIRGTVETTLEKCQESLDYRVVAGPVESETYRLTVFQPLVLRKIEATIEPPAYTRQKTITVEEGNFKVIEGSRVRFRFTLDRPPQTAELRLYPDAPPVAESKAVANRLPPALPLALDANVLDGELLSVVKPLEYELRALADDGMRLEPRRFRIEVQYDQRPSIRFVKPAGPIEVLPTAEVPMEVEAADDFGLAKVGIVYQVGGGPKKTLRLDELPSQPLSHSLLATLALEDEGLSFKDAVTYYAFAEDNDPGGPHRATTELQFIDIRPFKRAYQVLKTGGT